MAEVEQQQSWLAYLVSVGIEVLHSLEVLLHWGRGAGGLQGPCVGVSLVGSATAGTVSVVAVEKHTSCGEEEGHLDAMLAGGG